MQPTLNKQTPVCVLDERMYWAGLHLADVYQAEVQFAAVACAAYTAVPVACAVD